MKNSEGKNRLIRAFRQKYSHKSKLKNFLNIKDLFTRQPYLENLLCKASDDEQLLINCAEFDCVTFVETVLAILHSEKIEDFNATLQKIRYNDSKITWLDRKHYFTNWLQDNHDQGLINFRTDFKTSQETKKTLNLLRDYPAQEQAINYCDLSELKSLDSDKLYLLAFGSTLGNLDFKHVGFYSSNLLTHASKSKGTVVSEEIREFMERYGKCPGIAIAEVI